MNSSENDGRRAMLADALRLAPGDIEKLSESEERALVESAMALLRARKYLDAAKIHIRHSLLTLPTNHPLFDTVLAEMEWLMGCAAIATHDSQQCVRVMSDPGGIVKGIKIERPDMAVN